MSDRYEFENLEETMYDEHGFGEQEKAESNHRKGKNNRTRQAVKKAGALILSGVLFGSVSAACFQGMNHLTGYQAAAQKTTSVQGQTGQSVLKTSMESTGNKGTMDVSDIAKAAMPSIVAITSKTVQEVEDYFRIFGRNGQWQQEEVESCGSGIIIGKNDSELLIATNNHVVEGADSLSVSFVDDTSYEAVVKGTDAAKDLAVVAVLLSDISEDTLSKISIAEIGDSEKLEVGEQVVAIGNALGYGQAVTTGIVSATNRILDEEKDGVSYDGVRLIQTDAAINPGNSGGALLNMDGQVIGINSAKLASTEVEGMGYAIAFGDAYETIQNLMNSKTRTKVAEGAKASLGISGADVSEEAKEAYGIPAGVFVAEVMEDGAAEKAGMTVNTVITAFDGKTVGSIAQLKEMLEYYEAGETVEVTVQISGSAGYTEQNMKVTLGMAEAQQETEPEWDRYYREFSENFENPV